MPRRRSPRFASSCSPAASPPSSFSSPVHREIACRSRKDHAPENLAALRKLASISCKQPQGLNACATRCSTPDGAKPSFSMPCSICDSPTLYRDARAFLEPDLPEARPRYCCPSRSERSEPSQRPRKALLRLTQCPSNPSARQIEASTSRPPSAGPQQPDILVVPVEGSAVAADSYIRSRVPAGGRGGGEALVTPSGLRRRIEGIPRSPRLFG